MKMNRRHFLLLPICGCLWWMWTNLLNGGTFPRPRTQGPYCDGLKAHDNTTSTLNSRSTIHIGYAMCGYRTDYTTIKSVLWFTEERVHFHIIMEKAYRARLLEQLEEWRPYVRSEFQCDFIDPDQGPLYPDKTWKKWFVPCATGRLFMHRGVPEDVEWLIYMDTDTVALSSLRPLWDLQHKMNRSHLMGATLNDFVLNEYNKTNVVPLVPPAGINSGVLLLHLTELRCFDWLDVLNEYRTHFKSRIRLGDQCLLNSIFHFNPHMLYVFEPGWNFGYNFCDQCNAKRPPKGCDVLNQTGVYLIHGYNKAAYWNYAPHSRHIRIVQNVIANVDMKYRGCRTIVPPNMYNFKPKTVCEELLFRKLRPMQLEHSCTKQAGGQADLKHINF